MIPKSQNHVQKDTWTCKINKFRLTKVEKTHYKPLLWEVKFLSLHKQSSIHITSMKSNPKDKDTYKTFNTKSVTIPSYLLDSNNGHKISKLLIDFHQTRWVFEWSRWLNSSEKVKSSKLLDTCCLQGSCISHYCAHCINLFPYLLLTILHLQQNDISKTLLNAVY